MKIIKIKNYSKKFRNHLVLSDVNLEIESGKIYGLIGVNGSGKTVLLKSIAGLTNPSSGSIEVFGKNLHALRSFPEETGIIIEKPGFIPYFTAFENLKYLALINKKISDKEIKETIKLVGLNPDSKQKVKHFSLGMNQRLGIAQAIMEKPKLLLLDEPFNAIDIKSINHMRNLLINQKNNGTTILMTSHNREDLSVLCDEIYEISENKIYKMNHDKE